MQKLFKGRTLVAGVLVLATAAGAATIAGSGIAAAAGPDGSTGATTTTTAASVTPAATNTKPAFLNAQRQLEAALALRVTQLQKLQADVTANASTLGNDAATLSGRLSTELADINTLNGQAQSATTWAELTAARKAMLVDNRVFAVMTPQVIETIEADGIVTEVAGLEADEPGLQSAVNSVAGEPGGKNAENHFVQFVKLVNLASSDSSGIVATILAVTPQMWPNVEHVFAKANSALLQADLAVAHANYDAAVIGLATGGYTGS